MRSLPCFATRRLCCLLLLAASTLLFSPTPAAGIEPSKEFLAGLRARGLHDYAILYLEQMQSSPLASDEFKKTILYEMGATLVEGARVTGDTTLREKMFSDAREKLEAFAKANPGQLLAAKAQTQLANVLVERGRSLVLKAEQPSQAANKAALLAEARKFFDDGKNVFAAAEAFYTKELKDATKFPKDIPEKDPRFGVRQEFRTEQVQARLLLATVTYEKSKTYGPGTKENKALLTEAAKMYGEFSEKYRRMLAGLYARLYEGRCYQELKDYKTAMGCYEDLIIQPDKIPAFRTLITKAYVQEAQVLNAEKKYENTISKTETWLNKLRGTEERAPDGLALKYEIALAHAAMARALRGKDEKQMRASQRLARTLAKDPAKYPSDVQKDAKKLLLELGAGEDDSEPRTFAQAYEKGTEAIDIMKTASSAVGLAEKNNPEAVPGLKKQAADARANAFKFFRLALGLVDDDADIKKINLARYFLCYLNWEEKKYHDAAILGEFLARKYPASGGARQGAKIAMAAWLNLYNDTANLDKDFEAAKVVDVADFIVSAWPDQPEAADAQGILVNFLVQQGRLDEALKFLGNLKDEELRAQAELKIGQTQWANYVRGLKAADAEKPSPDELAAFKQEAQEMLASGVNRLKAGGSVGSTAANAGLSLAQIYLDSSQYEKAVAILEDAKLGPLTLIAAKHEATQRPGYAQEAYKVALRSYVTVSPPQLEKAEKMMDSLEKLYADNPDGEKLLTTLLIGLGRQLEKQLDVLKAEGNEKQIGIVAQSFEVFLDRIRNREKGNTWATRFWIASTYYNLGTGFDYDEGRKTKPEGKAYYEKAIAEFQKMLTLAKGDPEVKPDSVLGVRMRLAECQAKMGNYKDALNMLADVLAEKPMMLNAQIAAAYAYQNRGEIEALPAPPKKTWFYYCRMGGRKDKKTGKNRIWGWAKLSQITVRYPQYRDVFFEARFNIAKSRFMEAKKQKTAGKRKELTGLAKRDIEILYRTYPDMGGNNWQQQFDSLLKEVQKELKTKVVGLQEFAEDGKVAAQAGG